MPEVDKTCDYCGAPDAKIKSGLSDRYFCSIEHFRQFYKEHNSNDVIKSHELLSAAQILNLEVEDLAFQKEIESLTYDEKLKVINLRIEDLIRLQQRYKAVEFKMRHHVMNIREKQESEKTERYRQFGVNSDLELKNKRVSLIEKRITSYRKSNLSDDWILDTLKKTTGQSEEVIKSIMEEIK